VGIATNPRGLLMVHPNPESLKFDGTMRPGQGTVAYLCKTERPARKKQETHRNAKHN
jgi:hypothetical protein